MYVNFKKNKDKKRYKTYFNIFTCLHFLHFLTFFNLKSGHRYLYWYIIICLDLIYYYLFDLKTSWNLEELEHKKGIAEAVAEVVIVIVGAQ